MGKIQTISDEDDREDRSYFSDECEAPSSSQDCRRPADGVVTVVESMDSESDVEMEPTFSKMRGEQNRGGGLSSSVNYHLHPDRHL